MSEPVERLAYRAPEVAKLLGVSRTTVFAWVKDGTIPSIRVGGTVMIPRSGLEEWLARQTNGGAR